MQRAPESAAQLRHAIWLREEADVACIVGGDPTLLGGLRVDDADRRVHRVDDPAP
jgi:hypothetical protein